MGSIWVSVQYRHLGLFLKVLHYSEYSDYIFGTFRIFLEKLKTIIRLPQLESNS